MYNTLLNVSLNIEIAISDILSAITIVTIIISGIFALYKWSENSKFKRAEYIKTLTDEIRTNNHMAFYLFEYDEDWYGLDFHKGKEIEKKVDYTLSFFSYICYLRKQRIITDTEFDCFRYELERIINNSQFQDYMYNLYHFSKRLNQPISFVYLFEYAKDKACFNEEFWDEKSNKYPHYLNF